MHITECWEALTRRQCKREKMIQNMEVIKTQIHKRNDKYAEHNYRGGHDKNKTDEHVDMMNTSCNSTRGT